MKRWFRIGKENAAVFPEPVSEWTFFLLGMKKIFGTYCVFFVEDVWDYCFLDVGGFFVIELFAGFYQPGVEF